MTKNYRIKKVTERDGTKYYPQEKLFGLWMNMFGFEHYWDGSYNTFEEAQDAVCKHLRKPDVEYLEVDCGETK